MKVIYKFKISDKQRVELPLGASVISAAFQGHEMFIWALIDDTVESATQEFRVYGTGHHIREDEAPYLTYVDTCHGSGLVFHVFEYNR